MLQFFLTSTKLLNKGLLEFPKLDITRTFIVNEISQIIGKSLPIMLYKDSLSFLLFFDYNSDLCRHRLKEYKTFHQ